MTSPHLVYFTNFPLIHTTTPTTATAITFQDAALLLPILLSILLCWCSLHAPSLFFPSTCHTQLNRHLNLKNDINPEVVKAVKITDSVKSSNGSTLKFSFVIRLLKENNLKCRRYSAHEPYRLDCSQCRICGDGRGSPHV